MEVVYIFEQTQKFIRVKKDKFSDKNKERAFFFFYLFIEWNKNKYYIKNCYYLFNSIVLNLYN